MKLPHFLGIGAMRCGTTWLAEHLARHPEIRIGRKEVHFFDRKLGSPGPPGSSSDRLARLRYRAHFLRSARRPGLHGEITPAYAILEPSVISRVRVWLPHVRLVYFIRDPVARAWSQAQNDFPLWLGKPLSTVGPNELIQFLDSEGVRRRGDYASCIENWLLHYPREQLFVGLFDDIMGRPEALLADVFEFFGVDATSAPNTDLHRVVGASEPLPIPDWVETHLRETIPDERERLEALIGRPPPWPAW